MENSEYEVIICKVKDLQVGDTVVTWGSHPAGYGLVVWIDVKNREYAVDWDDPLEPVDGVSTSQWRSPYNNVKRWRRDGEVFRWEMQLARSKGEDRQESEGLPFQRART